jgi:autotransporter-associated beta strand protein
MKRIVLLLTLLCTIIFGADAQRVYQKMGRSVVAVTRDGGQNVSVSWRKLTNDPDSCTYNLYKRTMGTTSYTKVNTEPYRKTNVQLNGSLIPYDTELAVTTVSPAGKESEKSTPYLYKKQPWNNVFMYIEVDTVLLSAATHRIKYVWPADLNGDGEMNQFIVDRLGGVYEEEEDDSTTVATTAGNRKIQAYDIDGTLLWTVALGPNVTIDDGQNDMVTVCDIDCDGKAEVIIKSSDGTRFWDKEHETWGRYPFGSDTPDVDGDGIVNYCADDVTRNPPFYISVIDGMTGAEKVSAELNYADVHDGEDQYSRDNKTEYMQNKGYYQMGGHFAICYDGVRPFLAMKCLDRTRATQYHHDYVFAFGYDWVGGKPTNFHHFFTWSRNDKSPWPAEFHGNRVCDVDGDGIDEIIPGAFAVNPWKGMVSSGGIGHGDRFTVGDLDPTRPGLEHYAIQQSNLLGQVISDAATGEHLKEWYLPSVFDVGRGISMDVDSTTLGYESYSLVSDYIYDCKGKKTDTKRPTPEEGVWWDGDLLREALATSGGSGYSTNVFVQKVPSSTRLVDLSKESGWEAHATSGNRPGFFGDITGDWREEIILLKARGDFSTGIVGYCTDQATDYSITCLYEDGHYRGDCSTKGYYQSPNVSFYLGHGMKQEPLFDCIEADLRYKAGSVENGTAAFTTYDQTQAAAYADGKSLIFDISGDNSSPIAFTAPIAPSSIYLMNPKGHDYTFTGGGTLTGETVVKKGMQGTATFNMNLEHTGKTVISEGTLCVNGTIASSPIYLMSCGTLAGNLTISRPIFFEGALNYEGCRFMASTADSKFGTITINHNLTLPGDVYIESDLETATAKADQFFVNGDLTLTGKNYFTVNCTETSILPGTYTLAECTGTLTATTDNVSVRNLDGVPYRVQINGNKIQVIIDSQREATEGVIWTGTEGTSWDYLSKNFTVSGTDSYFVTGDQVVFDDTATQTDITLDGKMVAGGITFNNNDKTYTFTGDGGMSGSGDLVKNGSGEVRLMLENSDYTGRTIINEGRLTVSLMSDAQKASSLGAAVADKGYLQINGAELYVEGDNVATDRLVTISDTATISVVKSGTSLSLKDQISGRAYS